MKALPQNSIALFLLYARDAENWSGTPMVGGNVSLLGAERDRALLIPLKRAGLVETFADSDDRSIVWLRFTEAGLKFAFENGVSIEGFKSDSDVEDAVSEAREEEREARPVSVVLTIADRRALAAARRLFELEAKRNSTAINAAAFSIDRMVEDFDREWAALVSAPAICRGCGDTMLPGKLYCPGCVADGLSCDGHPAGPFDPMGQTVYCDGSCKGGAK